MSGIAGGWADLYNPGTGVTGGGNATPELFSDWDLMWADIQSSGTTPKVYIYTGPQTTTLQSIEYRADNIGNKTIYGATGQLLRKGGLRLEGWKNVIFRNFKRTEIDEPSLYECDGLRILGCLGLWIDHFDIYSDATITGTGTIEDGGIDISGESDFITISNTILRGNERTSLIVSDNALVANRGKARVTYRNCHWQNNHIRQPFVRFGKVHTLNCLFDYDPAFIRDPVTQYTAARLSEVGFESQIYSQGNYYGVHRYKHWDQDNNVGAISGLKSDGDFFETTTNPDLTSWTNGLEEIRPENVTWNPNTESGYMYPVALMTPQQAKVYVQENAGAIFHLISATTYTLTVQSSNPTFGTVSRNPASGAITAGGTVELTATPVGVGVFQGWYEGSVSFANFITNDNPHTITMNSDRTVIGSFIDGNPIPPEQPRKKWAKKRN